MIFDESKVISRENVEKAVIGKRYYFGDTKDNLERCVNNNNTSLIFTLTRVNVGSAIPFIVRVASWRYLYPFKEEIDMTVPLSEIQGFTVSVPDFGMTLRDYFAGQALEGLMKVDVLANDGEPITYKQRATIAYKQADAMLKERAK